MKKAAKKNTHSQKKLRIKLTVFVERFNDFEHSIVFSFFPFLFYSFHDLLSMCGMYDKKKYI